MPAAQRALEQEQKIVLLVPECSDFEIRYLSTLKRVRAKILQRKNGCTNLDIGRIRNVQSLNITTKCDSNDCVLNWKAAFGSAHGSKALFSRAPDFGSCSRTFSSPPAQRAFGQSEREGAELRSYQRMCSEVSRTWTRKSWREESGSSTPDDCRWSRIHSLNRLMSLNPSPELA